MTAILVDGPAAEPITLAEAKAFLRLDHAEEDGLLTAFITAARLTVEAATRRLLVAQQWRIVRDAWPGGDVVPIALAPVRSVEAVRVFSESGVATLVPSADFRLDTAAGTARLVFARPPAAPGRRRAGIEIDVGVGYGPPDAVPEPLRQAVRLLTAHLFEVRSAAADRALPPAAQALLAPYRVLAP